MDGKCVPDKELAGSKYPSPIIGPFTEWEIWLDEGEHADEKSVPTLDLHEVWAVCVEFWGRSQSAEKQPGH